MKSAFLALLGCAALLGACSDKGAPPMSGWAEVQLLQVAPTAGGVLKTVAVKRGQAVQAGQLLFTLDDEAEGQGEAAAVARRERAAAQSANLRQGRRPEELRVIDQQLAQAQAQLSASSTALERQQELVRQGFVSPLRLDELRSNRERDAARVAELQAQQQVARLAARGPEQAAADAELRASGADVELSRWRVGQRQRLAPVAAQVFEVYYEPGETVGAGMPVVALLPPSGLKLRFFVAQGELARATPGALVRLACDGCAEGLSARIRFVSPQAEYTPPVIYSNNARSKLVFLVEAEPADAATAAALRPGQPVDVRWAP